MSDRAVSASRFSEIARCPRRGSLNDSGNKRPEKLAARRANHEYFNPGLGWAGDLRKIQADDCTCYAATTSAKAKAQLLSSALPYVVKVPPVVCAVLPQASVRVVVVARCPIAQ